ncbi:MAG: DUF2232 domain-containing protein [Desulfobulbaceae bacterium]|nr:DUF2232 domain-containing protein [Desulfobulbaceae bacterium]
MHNLYRNLVGRLNFNPVATLITISTWTLPPVNPVLIGLQIFAPLPVFYFLIENGRNRGLAILGGALLISGLISILSGQTGAFVFTLLMLPTGLILAGESNKKNGQPWRAGLHAFLVLVLGWLLWAVLYGHSQPGQTSLYGDIIASLDQGLLEVGKTLKENTQIGPEQALEIETTVAGLRGLLPKVMPGLLLATMLNTVFLNMVLGQYFLRRKSAELTPWPSFANWRLPEPLVVLVIFAGISLLVPVQLINDIGLNLLLVSGTLYFFQGLTLLTGLLNRWSVPVFLRVLIFLLVLLQAYGIVILAVTGLVDVWADFRKPRPKPEVFED